MLSDLMICWAYLDQRSEFGDFSSGEMKCFYFPTQFYLILDFPTCELGCYQASLYCNASLVTNLASRGGGPGVVVRVELLGGGLILVGLGTFHLVVPSLRLQGVLTGHLAVRIPVKVALRLRLVIITI